MNALTKIRQSGFELNLLGDSFEVIPASKLTLEQREFLKLHKPQILSELKAVQAANVKDFVLVDTDSYELAKPKILSWLHYIGENNQEIIDEVLAKCRVNSDALLYFANRAHEVPIG